MIKKSIMKRAVLCLLTAVLALGMTATAAWGLPDPAAKGSITVHKLSAMKVSDDVQTGNEILDTSQYGKPLAGAGFSVTKVTLPTLASGKTWSTTQKPVVNTNATGVVQSVVFYDNAGTTYTASGASIGTAVPAVTTDANGVAAFTNLDQGYYALVETTTPAGYESSAPTLITVPLTKADGSGYLYDVHVYPKNLVNEGLITKKLDDGTILNISGKDINWTIDTAFRATSQVGGDTALGTSYELADLRTGTVGNYTYGTFSVTDTMDKFLSYKSAVLSFVGQDGNPVGVALTAATDYAVDTSVAGKVTWALTHVGIDKAIAANAAKLRVVVTTSMGSVAETGTPTVMHNEASYSMTPAGGTTPGGDPTVPVPAYKANIQVNKLFSTEAQKLIDAGTITRDGIKFKLATDAAGTTFVKDAANKDLEATTNADGRASFSGVPYDSAKGNVYYLVETAAKPGLHLKQNVIKVELAAGQANPTADYTVAAEVTNYAQTETDPDAPIFQLPLTGGAGTVLFTAVGLLIMAGAVFLVVRSRRKKA
ncbi:MAG: SpaH/EbpB family LPXTG-anchored major pilin [Gordonibacter sp.]|uniref:SpaH/EbpB family LPXTG-anchored major pilin n=1 Tax=Gordonibacter sp. TaxID=1968902 RepID=UPI002FC683F4